MTLQWKMSSAVARRVVLSSSKTPVAGLLTKRIVAGNGIHSAQFRTLSHLVNVYRSTPSAHPTASLSSRTYATAKAKTGATKKADTKKPAAGKKPVKKTKSATKKPAKKGRKPAKKVAKKRPLSEAQKIRLKEKRDRQKARDNYKQLVATALTPPKKLPFNMILVHMTETGQNLTNSLQSYQKLDEGQLQHLREAARRNREINARERAKWVKTFTPDQIREANRARQQISRMKKRYVPLLPDERRVKKPTSSFMIFMREHMQRPEYKNVPILEASARIGQLWRDADKNVKQKYQDQYQAKRARYIEEYKATYGKEPTIRPEASAA